MKKSGFIVFRFFGLILIIAGLGFLAYLLLDKYTTMISSPFGSNFQYWLKWAFGALILGALIYRMN